MNKISCEMCMDLMPLVQDGIASEESRLAVWQHMESCPACKKAFAGELPPADTGKLLHKLRRRRTLMAVTALLLALCIGLSAYVAASLADAKADEAVYMSYLYGDMRAIEDLAGRFSTLDPKLQKEAVIRLRCGLETVGDDLYSGYLYVSDSIRSVAAWWFDEQSVALHNSLSDSGEVTEDTYRVAQALQEDLQSILDQMVGPDGLNLDEDLTIEAFSDIIFRFYQGEND